MHIHNYNTMEPLLVFCPREVVLSLIMSFVPNFGDNLSFVQRLSSFPLSEVPVAHLAATTIVLAVVNHSPCSANILLQCPFRAVYRNFAEGGRIWGMDKRGGGGGGAPGGSSIVSCEVLHSRGGENDTRGGQCPSPPPLKYGPAIPPAVLTSCCNAHSPCSANILLQCPFPLQC